MRTRKCARRSCRAGTGKGKLRACLMRYHTAAGLLEAWLQVPPGLATVGVPGWLEGTRALVRAALTSRRCGQRLSDE